MVRVGSVHQRQVMPFPRMHHQKTRVMTDPARLDVYFATYA